MSSLASSDCLLDSVRGIAQQDSDVANDFQLVDLKLSKVNSKLIHDLRKQKDPEHPTNYLIDQNGNFYVTDSEIALPDGKLTVGVGRFTSGSQLVIPQEVGVLRYNSASKKIELEPTTTIAHNPREIEELHAKLLAENPDLQLTQRDSSEDGRDKVLECADLISQKQGMTLLRDRLIATTLVNAAAIVAVDKKQIESKDSQKTAAVDLLAGNVGALTTGLLLNQFSKTDISSSSQVAILLGRSELMSYLLAPLYNTNSKKKKRREEKMHLFSPAEWGKAEKMFWYNTAYTGVSTAVTPLVERQLISKISDFVYNQCMAGGKVSVILGPAVIRIVERGAMTYLYFKLRKKTIGQ